MLASINGMDIAVQSKFLSYVERELNYDIRLHYKNEQNWEHCQNCYIFFVSLHIEQR